MSSEKIEGEISLRFTDDNIVAESKALAKAISGMGDQIESDLDDIGTSADKVQKEFARVGKSAKDGGAKASKALDQTGEKAKKAATKLKETGAAGKKAGDDVAAGADKGARAMDNMATSAGDAENNMETLSTSMIGLAQTATGVSDAIFGLSASLVGLEKTQFGIKGMEIAIERMERGLIVAYNEGILTTQELEDATVDLGLAYFGLSLEEKQAAADQLALNGQMVTLAINTGAAVFQSVILIKTLTAMKGVKTAITATTITESAATVTNTAVNTGNTGGIIAKTGATIASTVATVASTIATRAMTLAMLLSPLAPFAIAAIGVGAAFIALNDNIGGVRDSIEDLTGAERGSIPTLGFSITGLGDDVNQLDDDLINLADSFEAGQENAFKFTQTINPLTLSIGDLSKELTIFSSVTDSFANQIQGAGIIALDSDMKSLVASVKLASDSMEEFPGRVNLAMETIGPSIQNTAKQFDLAWGEGAFRRRLIEMRKFGELTREEFNLIGQTVDLTSQKIDNLISKKNDELGKINNDIEETEIALQGVIELSRLALGRNIVGSNLFLISAAAKLSLTRGAFGNVTSNINFGTTSSFASSQGGGPGSTARRTGSSRARSGQGGSANRHDNNKALKALDARFGGDRSNAKTLSELTGINLQLQVDQVVRKGYSGPRQFRFDLLDIKIAEANARVNLVDQIKFLNPFSTAHPRMSSDQLQIILTEEQQKISFTQEALGLSQSEAISIQNITGGLTKERTIILQQSLSSQQIQDFLTTKTGLNDLTNLIGWSQREELLRVLV